MSNVQPPISEKTSASVPQYGNLPLIGMLPYFIGDHPLHVLYEAMMQGGGLVQLKLGVTSAYLVSSPEAFQHILRDNHHNYPKPRMFYGTLKKLIGNGLVTSEGDFWLRQRRMIQPYMHRKYLSGLTDIMVAGIDEALDSWESYIKRGETLDFGQQMSRVTINVVTKSMFGQDISVAQMDAVSQVVPALLDYLNTRGFLSFIPEWVPLPGDQKFTENYAVLRQQLMRLIDERRQDASGATDLVTMLINAVDNETNEQMTDDQLFDEALTIFAAGFETTSTTLTWLWYILSQHPDIEQKLRAEIQATLGSRIPAMEDIRNLPYTRMVISETLRMFPPAPLLPRRAIEADSIEGYPIPANANMLLFYYGLHHNPAIWEQPETFSPERFLPDATTARSQFAWIPFSAGPRKCIGDEFAMMEAILTVARVLQRYQLHVTTTNVEPYIGSTLRTSKPIVGTVTKFNDSSTEKRPQKMT